MSSPIISQEPGSEPTPVRHTGVWRTTFRAFHYRNFSMMWAGAFTSTTGSFFQEVAQAWLVYILTDSAFLLGFTAFLQGIPILLLSLLGGVAADRMDRRKLLLGSQYAQMTVALTLATLIGFDMILIWHIMVGALVTGVAQAFGGPAYQALIPSLVDKEDLPNAIALMSIQFNLARVIGPALGGIAITALGASACFAINGFSFLAVIVSLYFIHVRYIPAKSDVDVLQSLKDGVLWVHRNEAMRGLIVLSTITAFLGVPLVTMLPVFAEEVYQLGPRGLGMLMSFSGAGAVVGALFVAWLGNVGRKGRVSLMMTGFLGAATIVFALSKTLWIGCAFIFLTGYALLAVFAMQNSLVQLLCPEEMRGRIMSVYNMAFRGAMPLGNLTTGTLATPFSAPFAVAANGVVLVLVGAWYLVRGRQLKEL